LGVTGPSGQLRKRLALGMAGRLAPGTTRRLAPGTARRLAWVAVAAGTAAAGLAGCSHPAAKPPAAGSMLALSFSDSPIKFRVVTCGPLSPAQQAAAHTRARNGVVIRATNTGTVAVMPTFTVEFFRGHKHKWDGTNYTSTASPALAPGRSRDFEADIFASEWAGHPGDSCLVTQEDVFQIGEFTNVATYRARAVPLKAQPTPTKS
jgi:hypothetical protein